MLESIVKRAEKIVIYGAGAIANMTYIYLCDLEVVDKIQYYVVTKMGNNPPQKNGLEVVEISSLKKPDYNILFLIATQEVVQDEIVNGLLIRGFKNCYKIREEEITQAVYKTRYQKSIVNNKILFSNMKGLGYGGNPKYIAEKLLELDKEQKLDLVWAVSDTGRYHFPDKIRCVVYGTGEYYDELATAHIWIDNVRKTADVQKREGQYYIQTWHGAAPMKKVEKDVIESLLPTYVQNAKKDSEMADLFLSGSDFYTNLYRTAFWYQGKIMQVGLPRHDIFWSTQEAMRRVKKFFSIGEDTAIVLFAPTFRADYDMAVYDMDICKVRDSLEKKFMKKFVFLIGRHPNNRYLAYAFKFDECCIDVSGYEDFQEIVAAADVLITDYSGCAYDFSFTRRPIFLYQPDYERYVKERDFYIPVSEMPYNSAKTNKELMDVIHEFDDIQYQRKLKMYMERFGNYDTGYAAKAVAEYILQLVFT